MTPTFSCCRQAIKAQPANTLRIDLPTDTSSNKAKKVCVGGMTIPTLAQHALASAEPMPYKEIMERDPAFIRYLRSLPAEAVGYAFGNVLELYQYVKGKDSEVTLVRRDIQVACFAYVLPCSSTVTVAHAVCVRACCLLPCPPARDGRHAPVRDGH